MSVRTFCNPDSVIKKHMHDTHKVLEMLGAPLVTFLAFQELQVKALATIRETQKKKAENTQAKGAPKLVEVPPASPNKKRLSIYDEKWIRDLEDLRL